MSGGGTGCGPSGNAGHTGMPMPMYGNSAVGGPRFSSDQMGTITHSGMSAGSSIQAPAGHNTISMQYPTQAGQMGQNKAPQQPHFIAVTSNRARMPLQKDDIKVEQEEQPMDTSGGAASSIVMASDGGSAEASSAGSQSEQRLKVEDALNYLDQVKYKFGNQPQVYNDFLDIMKEFKSQSIDTPGVIARVSHLFRGHPELIVGFNTFLPPGYKIEIQANDSISLSMIGQGGGYVVTTVQPGLPGPGGHPTTQSTLVHQHPAPPTPAARPPITNITTGTGRMSPLPTALPANTSNAGGSTSAFTHSFTSPFVQSAFPSLQTQPVEFNHAINYVNKIKNRFQGHPDKYKQFLEILHTYQKEQRNIKDGHPPSSKHLTEHEVYSQVAKLFENQEDLLKEFGQFLPDATNHQNTSAIDQAKKSVKMSRDFVSVQPANTMPSGIAQKRPAIQPSTQDRKKPKEMSSANYGKQVSLVEAARYGTLNDFAFFDKVRVVMKSPIIYNNFLRCVNLFSDQLFSANELLTLVNPFLAKNPELHNWFKDFVGVKHESASGYYDIGHPSSIKPNEKLTEEQMVEIDYTTCKRLGASYCAMPNNNLPPKCSGRSLLPLCNEVLNDVWVSFPAWSEDTAFSSSRKTAFEECMYRVEDERFELDVVIETNAAVIRALEYVAKKMTRMSPEELADFELDDCLGGASQTIHQRAIRRIYGEKATEIIEGLKKQPVTAIPLVLRRLKAKEEEWRESQKHFNKAWTEQTEKFYLKSLDLQGITFKQTDVRALRSKALVNEIETLFDERQERMITNPVPNSPHLTLLYRDRNLLDDACLLLLHHVRRQTSIHKEDKRKIKQLLKHLVADLFHHARMELSDDEDEGSHDDDGRRSPQETTTGSRKRNGNGKKTNGNKAAKKEVDDETPSVKDSTSADTAPGPSSTASVWSELTKQKKLSTAQESQESRRTIAKRELKLLLSDAKAHELTEVGRTSLRDKVNREYLSEMSKEDSMTGSSSEQPASSKRRSSRRSFSQCPEGAATPGTRVDPGIQRSVPTPSLDEDEAYSLFFANSKLYVFLRLHHILCERLSKIHERAAFHLMEYQNMEKNSVADYLRMIPPPVCEVSNYYQHFLELIRSLLDGNIEASVYEDTLREMFGIHAYIAYTMDKVVSNAVRQLQGIMTDEASQKCLEMFHQAGKRNGNGGFLLTVGNRATSEMIYQKQVEKLCGEETCVKVMIFKKHCRMTMELLECDTPSDAEHDQKAKYSNYVSKFLKPDSSIPESIMSALGANPVFLARNVRKWRKKNLLEWKSDNAKRSQEGSGGHLRVIKVEQMDIDHGEGDVGVPELPCREQIMEEGIKIEDNEAGTQEIVSQPPQDVTLGGNVAKTEDSSIADSIHDDSGGQLVMKSLEKSQKERTVEFLMQENLQCQFNLSSYRMVYLTNSEDCIYLKGAMQRARKTHKKLSLKLSAAFQTWHQNWLIENVPDATMSNFNDFLLDKNNTISPRKTYRRSVSRADGPPYRKYHKYVLEKD